LARLNWKLIYNAVSLQSAHIALSGIIGLQQGKGKPGRNIVDLGSEESKRVLEKIDLSV